jgi:hypothetical protein
MHFIFLFSSWVYTRSLTHRKRREKKGLLFSGGFEWDSHHETDNKRTGKCYIYPVVSPVASLSRITTIREMMTDCDHITGRMSGG